MRQKKISNNKLAEIYDLAIQCRDKKTAATILKNIAERNGVSYKYLRETLYNWCRATSKTPIDKYISDAVTKEVSEIISKNPENIQKCFRKYVANKYPELNIKSKQKEFNKKVYSVSSMWYHHGNKSHVCFMTVSSKGKAIINGKTSSRVNKEYTPGFFKGLKVKIMSFFKNIL